MRKITLLLTLFFAATMTMFAQDENTQKLTIVSTNPTTDGYVVGGINFIDFTFSEEAIVITDVVKYLDIKNDKDEVLAQINLATAYPYPNTGIVYLNIMPLDSILHKDEYGEYYEYVMPDLTAPGEYTITIPAGVFVSKADNSIALEETTLTFNVVEPQPTWNTDYDFTQQVYEFSTININFYDTKEVKLNDANAASLWVAGAEYPGTAELVTIVDEKDGKTSYRIQISFGQTFNTVGEYTVVIPADMFTMNGDINNAEKEVTFKIIEPLKITPLELVNYTPEIGSLGEITEIKFEFNQRVQFGNENQSNYVIYLTNENGEKFALWPKDPYDWFGNLVIPSNTVVFVPVELSEAGWPTYDANGNFVGEPIKEAGTYTLNLNDITIYYGHDPAMWVYNAFTNLEGEYKWTIAPAAIEDVNAEAENAEIFDLTGRRVKEITNAGIYIINGVKKIVK